MTKALQGSGVEANREPAGPGWRGLIRHGAINWTLADQIVVSGANFATTVIVAQFLGPDGFGVFAMSWLVVLLAQSLVTAAITMPLMSVGPKQSAEHAESYYASTLHQQLAVTLLTVALALTGLAAVRLAGVAWTYDGLILPVAACIVSSQVQEFLRRYNFTVGRPAIVMRSDALRYAIQMGALVAVLSSATASVESALWAVAVASLAGIGAFAGAMPRWRRPSGATTIATLSRNVRFSRWLVASAILQWTTGNFFVLLSGAMLGPAAAGALRAAQTLIGVTHVFFQAADNIVPPRAARLQHTHGNEALRRFVLRLLLIGTLGTALFGLVLAVPARFWLALVYGDGFAGYGWLVAGYAIAYVLLAAAVPLRYAFLAVERTRPIFVSYAWGSAFTLTAAWPLIHFFGLTGAIVGIAAVNAVLFASLATSFIGAFRR